MTVDPDVVQDDLSVLSFCTDSAADAMWHLLVEIDPEDLIVAREKQKMALARYARQSLLQWDDVEVRQIRRWCERLKELLDQEGAIARKLEDG